MAPTTTAPRRRLPPAERREQLVEAALAIAARTGSEGLSFDEVAQRAEVSRNLVYHYFPGGRRDLFLAAIRRAGEHLTGEWLIDREIPLEEKLAANFERLIDQAAEPTDAWLLHRQSRASVDPEAIELADSYYDLVLRNISQNHLGTDDPPPLVRIALRGFIAYAESALDAWQGSGIPRATIAEVLRRTLIATVEASARPEH